MATINMHDAKTQLSDLVARAEAGEEIVIARRNKPAVRLVPVMAGREVATRGFAEDGQADFDMRELRDAVAAGREFTIMKDGEPVAKVVPVEPEQKSRGWGGWEGRYQLPDSFFDPLPEDELQGWDGSHEPPS
jgi:prevent-host-death family protein